MAGTAVVVSASVAACGGSSSPSSSKNFCANLNKAGTSISGDLQQVSSTPKSALQKDAQTLTNLAGSAPQQLKKPLNDIAGFLKDAEALAGGGTPDSATVQRITAETQTVQGDSQTLSDYVTKNCKGTATTGTSTAP